MNFYDILYLAKNTYFWISKLWSQFSWNHAIVSHISPNNDKHLKQFDILMTLWTFIRIAMHWLIEYQNHLLIEISRICDLVKSYFRIWRRELEFSFKIKFTHAHTRFDHIISSRKIYENWKRMLLTKYIFSLFDLTKLFFNVKIEFFSIQLTSRYTQILNNKYKGVLLTPMQLFNIFKT